VVAFLGPSLPAAAARRLGKVRVLPPARAGDLLAVLPSRPLAIALVDGLFDTTPSVWHREISAALEAGVAVFGAASLGALRAAELSSIGMVGVGRIFGLYRDGILNDDGEVALLHADREHAFRPLTLPLVQVRAAVEAVAEEGLLLGAQARRLLKAAARLHYTERSWAALAAALPSRGRPLLLEALRKVPDLKAEDAVACLSAALAFANARARGAPQVPPPLLPPPSSYLRHLRLSRAPSLLNGGAEVLGSAVLERLGRRKDAPRLAALGLSHLLLARFSRGLGLTALESGCAEAELAFLRRLGKGRAQRDAALQSLGLDEGAARTLMEDLALEAKLLSLCEKVVPDGPSWEEGLALGARLTGAWLTEAARKAPLPPRGVRKRKGRS
jgi:hypothetical protein